MPAAPRRSRLSTKKSKKPAAKSRPARKAARTPSPAVKKTTKATGTKRVASRKAARPARQPKKAGKPGAAAKKAKTTAAPKKAIAKAAARAKPAPAPAKKKKPASKPASKPAAKAQGKPAARKVAPARVPAKSPRRSHAPPQAAPEPPPPPPPPPKPLITLTVATRQSALALAQAELAIAHLKSRLPDYDFRLLPLVTTGDRQAEWSLEQQGGKGLFIGELEAALLDGRADLAIHSAKDLPTAESTGLQIAGFLPRADARDVLVIRKELPRPNSVATGSPRRRQQLQRQFSKATFCEIRGNVETRLDRITEGLADSTVLAAAGLSRLNITERAGMRFQILPLAVCVPAVGQGAIAVQARADTAAILAPVLDEVTRRAVVLERAFLRRMDGGCHTAFAVHYDGIGVHLFHDSCGYQRFAVTPQDALEPERVAARILASLELNA